jgi:ComF family protein
MAPFERPIVDAAADLICPERCAACATLVDPRALFCVACAAMVHRLGPPECAACGAPLPVARRCASCTDPDFPIRAARAWAAYHRATASPVATTIAHFKYGGAHRLGRRLATVLLSRVPDPTVALVVPVPLYGRRLRERGFNQSAVLARHLARRLGCRVALSTVVRTRDTPSQVGLGVAERARNVAAAFAVPLASRIQGRTVLVVDDVWTSGATACAVAHALRAAGAAAVDVLTIARVL